MTLKGLSWRCPHQVHSYVIICSAYTFVQLGRSRSSSLSSARSASPVCSSPQNVSASSQRPKQSYANAKHARKRRAQRADADAFDYIPSPRIAQVHGEPEAVKCSASTSDFGRAKGA